MLKSGSSRHHCSVDTSNMRLFGSSACLCIAESGGGQAPALSVRSGPSGAIGGAACEQGGAAGSPGNMQARDSVQAVGADIFAASGVFGYAGPYAGSYAGSHAGSPLKRTRTFDPAVNLVRAASGVPPAAVSCFCPHAHTRGVSKARM